jgi:hypothetical protein
MRNKVLGLLVVLILLSFAVPPLMQSTGNTTRHTRSDLGWGIVSACTVAEISSLEWHPSGDWAVFTTWLWSGGPQVGKYHKNGTIEDLSTLVDAHSHIRFNATAFRPDGAYCLIGGDFGFLYSYDGTSFQNLTADINLPYGKSIVDIDWNADSSKALLCTWSGDLHIYNGITFTNLSGNVSGIMDSVSWAPNGTYAFIGSYDGLWAYHDPGSTFYDLSDEVGIDLDILSLAWSTGDRCLITGYNMTSFQYEIWTFDAGTFTQLLDNTPFLTAADWKPGGDYWLLCGYGIHSFNGTDLITIDDTVSWVWDVSWRPQADMALLAGSYLFEYRFLNNGPYLFQTIDVPDMYEDDNTSGKNLLNMSLYIFDDNDNGSLRFIVPPQENTTLVNLSFNGSWLTAEQMVQDWFGTLNFSILAFDSGDDGIPDNGDDLNLSVEFGITVLPTNDPPLINTTVEDGFCTEGEPFQMEFNGSDIDGDTLSWVLNSNATFLSLVDNVVSGTPNRPDCGLHYINVTLLDNNGSYAFVNFTLCVNKTNDPPVFNGTVPPIVFDEDTTVTVDMSTYGFDPEGEGRPAQVPSHRRGR